MGAMNKFIWKDEYSVGIPTIDKQHKDYFVLANEIVDMLQRREATTEKLHAITMKLEAHAIEHFDFEEKNFDLFHYPGAVFHTEAHELYRKRINGFYRALDEPNANVQELADEIASYTIYFLSDHILLMDLKYSAFFKEHGVS
jgi:hemerythrin